MLRWRREDGGRLTSQSQQGAQGWCKCLLEMGLVCSKCYVPDPARKPTLHTASRTVQLRTGKYWLPGGIGHVGFRTCPSQFLMPTQYLRWPLGGEWRLLRDTGEFRCSIVLGRKVSASTLADHCHWTTEDPEIRMCHSRGPEGVTVDE